MDLCYDEDNASKVYHHMDTNLTAHVLKLNGKTRNLLNESATKSLRDEF